MKKSFFIAGIYFLMNFHPAVAARVDTVLTNSTAMKKQIKTVVILPEGYEQGKAFPTVYLLHGYGDHYPAWVKKVPAVKQYADDLKMIIVCPDGNVGSWYFDSPVDPAWKYETYVSTELVGQIDEKYKTIKDRKGRAITGLSMGGHGALFLAFRHQETFGAAGSMSGGVDLVPFPNNWDIAKRLGSYDSQSERWKANSVVNMVDLLTPDKLSLIIDCGISDFFYEVNMKLHENLVNRKIPHDFIIRPGEHNWNYWSNAIGFQLLYFHNYFSRT